MTVRADAPLRVLLVNENLGGHATMHLAIGSAFATMTFAGIGTVFLARKLGG